MKLRKLAGLGVVAVAAAGFAMSAMAAHHATSKNVKCAVPACKDGKACDVMVTKDTCEKLGGAVKTASAAKAPKVSAAAVPATTAQTAEAQPAPQAQAAGQQTAAAAAPAAPATQNQ